MTKRRLQERIPDADLVMIGWVEGTTSLKQLGNVDNLSPAGMGVRIDEPVAVGTTVEISYGCVEEGTLTGVVKHHFERPDGHYIGIEFTGNSKDSALHFQPELIVSHRER
jgi:PilZ domain